MLLIDKRINCVSDSIIEVHVGDKLLIDELAVIRFQELLQLLDQRLTPSQVKLDVVRETLPQQDGRIKYMEMWDGITTYDGGFTMPCGLGLKLPHSIVMPPDLAHTVETTENPLSTSDDQLKTYKRKHRGGPNSHADSNNEVDAKENPPSIVDGRAKTLTRIGNDCSKWNCRYLRTRGSKFKRAFRALKGIIRF